MSSQPQMMWRPGIVMVNYNPVIIYLPAPGHYVININHERQSAHIVSHTPTNARLSDERQLRRRIEEEFDSWGDMA